jgi:hypothetical protein
MADLRILIDMVVGCFVNSSASLSSCNTVLDLQQGEEMVVDWLVVVAAASPAMEGGRS